MSADDASKNFVTLIATNANQALVGPSQGLASAFGLAGYHNTIIDLLQPGGLSNLFSMLSEGEVDFACAFAGVGSQLGTDGFSGPNIWAALKIPFVSFWYDHPCYNYAQHGVDSSYVLNCYHVRDHYDVWSRFFSSRNRAINLQPFMGINPHRHDVPWWDRHNKILYVKSGIDPQSYEEIWKGFPPKIVEIIWALVDLAKKDRNIDLVLKAEDIMKTSGQPTDDLGMFMGIIQEVDGYIRAWRSDQMVRALLPCDAVIIGGGWDYLTDGETRAQFLPSFPRSQLLQTVAQFRIIANTNPLWRCGVHERVGYGMGSGAVVLTDRTDLSDEAFGDLENYITFDWSDDLTEAISCAFRKSAQTPVFARPSVARVKERFAVQRENFINPVLLGLKSMRGSFEA